MALIQTESQDPSNLMMAKELGEYLASAYPNHSWHVRIDGGIVVVKNMAVSGTIGMVRHFKDIAHDAKTRKHDILIAAGELLERARLRREYGGEHVDRFDSERGVKWAPQIRRLN